MFQSSKPAILTTTALLVRNNLSERVWGTHGVNTLALDDPQPQTVRGAGVPAHHLLRRGRPAAKLHGEHRPHFAHPVARSKAITGIGVIGDSISDEYRFYAPDRVTARNWVEILATARELHFGDPVTANRGMAQDRRLAYNWSRSSATTTSLIAQGQHRGLAAQVAGGAAIDLASVTIGTNDFVDVLIKSRSKAALRPVLERATANLAAILGPLLRTNSTFRIAVFTAVDLRCSPLLRGALDAGLIPGAAADAYGSMVMAFNERLRDLLAGHGRRVVIVDSYRLLTEVALARSYVVGGLEIDCVNASNDPRHLFLADGFHPGTIGQCLLANQFLDAINAGFDTGIPLLSGEEMIDFAYSVQRPSGRALIGIGVLALLGYGRRRPRVA
ncbi:SGNH/GDSL hydrolase family protein [Paludisphaera soli]|uniref:SGNH/GDSL hydrolase family protein n=1 Tax=Paludisphaera soli TaxID=2712865 RepID=UPI001F0DB669|nr:SGNH/GDSL hydrolase family protein [Paludisphaera soli]